MRRSRLARTREDSGGRSQQGRSSANLRDVREIAGMTQAELGDKLNKTQAELSKFERRKDFRLSTLNANVKAIGGEVEVVVRLGTRAFRLRSLLDD